MVGFEYDAVPLDLSYKTVRLTQVHVSPFCLPMTTLLYHTLSTTLGTEAYYSGDNCQAHNPLCTLIHHPLVQVQAGVAHGV